MRWDIRQKRLERTSRTGPSYKNPLFVKKTWQLFVIERMNFFIWSAILVILATVYFFFYSPIFQITKVEIHGLSNEEARIFEEKFIVWQMQQRKWLVFKQSNVFLFSKEWLGNNIKDKYNPESVSIEKKIPHTLIINLQEKNPAFIWITNDTHYYLEESGKISVKIDKIDEAGDYPLIYDEANQEVKPGSVILTKDKISFIKKLITALAEMSNLNIISYSVTHSLTNRVNAQTEAGYQIYFDTSKDIDSQTNKLQQTLNELETQPQEYIDLRIGDRVYIK